MTQINFPQQYLNWTVGYEDFFNDFDITTNTNSLSNFPPYNIERTGKSSYVVEFALAGFSKEDIKVTLVKSERKLVVEGERKTDSEKKNYSHRGIANRAFEKTLILAEFMETDSISFKDGLLTIEISEHLPEENQPQVLEISG